MISSLGQFLVRILNSCAVWEFVSGIVLESKDNYSIILFFIYRVIMLLYVKLFVINLWCYGWMDRWIEGIWINFKHSNQINNLLIFLQFIAMNLLHQNLKPSRILKISGHSRKSFKPISRMMIRNSSLFHSFFPQFFHLLWNFFTWNHTDIGTDS